MVRFVEDEAALRAAPQADDPLAPVIPLFGASATRANRWGGTWHDSDDGSDDGDADDGGADDFADDAADGGYGEALKTATERLIRRLRRRGLSVAEAIDALVADGVDRVVAGLFVAELENKRWLGDAALAEELVHSGVERKGQGRHVIAQTLAKRRIPRDVAEAALAALPDDDAERALEYARSKAASFRNVDAQAAIRRLTGQLARRGYPSSVAMSAAKRALTEVATR